jgi:CheY-like chemotaxis protein
MDGFELAARIREIPSQVPLMMLTSDNLAGDLAKRAATGLAGYAMKPVRRSELLRQLGLMLASKTEAPAIETASSPAAPARTGAVADGVRPLEILIAEDGESNRDVLRAYFKKTSHRLTFVENGEFAVRTFAENREKFDIVLMDMHMPVMDGRSATREIRALEVKHGLTAIPIIAVTANARNEDIQMSREAGCSHHLSKPLSKQTLFRTLEEYAGRRLPQAQATPKIELPEDEDLLELVPGYVEDRLKDVAGMMELLSAADYDRLWTLGHELKGTGTSYGLPDLTKMGADFEKAARRKNEAEIGAQIRQLADYLKRVQTTLGVTQLTR